MTCYTQSCTSIAYRTAPIRLQLFCVAMVTRGRKYRALSLNIARLLKRIGKCALRNINCNMTLCKMANFCIPAEQLCVLQVTRPSPAGVRGWLRETRWRQDPSISANIHSWILRSVVWTITHMPIIGCGLIMGVMCVYVCVCEGRPCDVDANYYVKKL